MIAIFFTSSYKIYVQIHAQTESCVVMFFPSIPRLSVDNARMLRCVACSYSKLYNVAATSGFAALGDQRQPSAVLDSAAAVCVAMIFLRNNFSKFSASIVGGPPSIIDRILGVRPMDRKHERLRTRESMA